MKHPNIVILGLRHVNSGIVVRMLLELGWRQNDLDEHGESVEIRNINRTIRLRRDYRSQMKNALASMDQPWVLKDPGFRLTLMAWSRVLTPYSPVLVYLTKDSRLIANSLIRRMGEKGLPKIPVSEESIEEWSRQCRLIYDWWSGPKIEIGSESICRAVDLFDVARAREGQPIPEEVMARVFTGDPNSNHYCDPETNEEIYLDAYDQEAASQETAQEDTNQGGGDSA